jgi:ribosomal protein L29
MKAQWMVDNLTFCARTAHRYMALADGKKTLAELRMSAATRMQEKRQNVLSISPARKTINKALTRAAPMRRS